MSLLGVAAHLTVPQGEDIGATFRHCGKTYYVTQSELDRVKAMPSADEVRNMVARFRALTSRDTPGAEQLPTLPNTL